MKHIWSIATICILGVLIWLSVLQVITPSHMVAARVRGDDGRPRPNSSLNGPVTMALSQTTSITVYLPLMARPESTIAGHVFAGSVPVPGVLISTSTGRTGTTDATGAYQIYVPDGTQSITPTLAGYIFSPTMRLVTIPPSAQNQDFEATPPPCSATNTVFYDDFSNPNSGWGEENIAAWYRHYVNGEYEATLHVNTELFHAAPGIANTLNNFVVSADLRQTDAPEYSDGYGLWIGSASLGKYYEFDVSTNTMFMAFANYHVTYYDSSEPIWIGKDHGTSSAVNMENAVNALRVHRCGSRYYFYANDTLLTSLVMPELANQPLTVGYYVRAVHDATVRLDNFRILHTAP